MKYELFENCQRWYSPLKITSTKNWWIFKHQEDNMSDESIESGLCSLIFVDASTKVSMLSVDWKSYEKWIIITTLVTLSTNGLLKNFVFYKANRWIRCNVLTSHDRRITVRTMEFTYHFLYEWRLGVFPAYHSRQGKRMNRTTSNTRFNYSSGCICNFCYD
jgi:hypothetical protein